MNFDFNEEQKGLIQMTKEFVRSTRGETRTWPMDEEFWEMAKMLSEHGYMGLTLPEEYGGSGMSMLDAILIIEEMCKIDPGSGRLVYHSSIGNASFLWHLGNEDQRRRYIPKVCAGELVVGLGISEAEAGSAATDLVTKAEKKGDVYILNGNKQFISYAEVAELFVVLARVGSSGKPSDIGAFLVDKNSKGFEIGKPEINMSGELQCPLYFDDCEVPVENLLAEENAFRSLFTVYNGVRLGLSAQTLGVAEGAYNKSLQYVRERKQFGREICEFQAIQTMIADMKIKLEAARYLLYRACNNCDNGIAEREGASSAKVFIAEITREVCDMAIQIFGGYGYQQDFPIEWYYRIVRGSSIAGGTLQIHKTAIAEEALGRRFNQRPPKNG